MKTKSLSKMMLLGTALCLAAPALASDLPGAGKTVRYAIGDSLGANYVHDHIIIKGLEDLGYKVRITNVNTTSFFQAASQGDMDLMAAVNMPQQNTPFQRLADRLELVSSGQIIGGGYNGYVMDKATADAKGIKDLSDLKDPEIAKLFDTDGDGTANLMNCDPGWGCGDVVDHQLKAFGLSETVESVRAKYEPLLAETFARAAAGQPVLYYTWSPSFVTQTLVPGKDVVWLPIPFDTLPEGVNAVGGHDVPGVEGCAANQDPCKMATGSWNWRAVAGKEFAAENPVVAKLADTMKWPIGTWSDWEVAVKKDSSDSAIKAVALEWVEQNRATYDAWLAEAKAAAK